MLIYVYQALESFQGAFSRQRTWLIFCSVIICLMATSEMIGVTSICRFWLSSDQVYSSLLKFFRSKAFCHEKLQTAWSHFVLTQKQSVVIDDRQILLGDHTHVVKDGRRMPGVVSIRETSETQSKPNYFRGQCWGAIGLLVGTFSACFCLPLHLQLHQGFTHLGHDKTVDSLSMAERLVLMALHFSHHHDQPCVLVLDAFFSVGTVFRLTRSFYSIASRRRLVEVITKAKKNYVAYFFAPPKPTHQPGPQPSYGEKVYLQECFNHPHLFHEIEANVYGKTESIRLMTLTLLWKPIGDTLLFVFAVTSRGPIILMATDLMMSPVNVLELYCARTRIEIMFDVLKHIIGAFKFRFWTKKMPSHSRKPCSNKNLKKPQPEDIEKVHTCWRAYESFVLCGAIAQGLLQLIALKFKESVWQQHCLYLRTKSRDLPSEKTVKQIFSQIVTTQLCILHENGIIQKIRLLFMRETNKNLEYA